MTPPTTPSRNSTSFDRTARRSERMPTPTKPPMGIDAHLQAVMDRGSALLKAGKSAQTAGTVTGSPVQNSVAPLAPTAPAPGATPNQPWWHSLADHIMSWFAPPAVKSVSKGAAYLADGGKSRTAGVNKVIDEASK